MQTLDWIIIAVIALSTVMSLWRGAVREVLSLTTWVLATYVGVRFASDTAGLLAGFIENDKVRLIAAALLLGIVVLIIGGLLGQWLARMIKAIGLTGLDRLLGLFFGFVRGVLILAVLVFFAHYTELPTESWWQSSRLMPYMDKLTNGITNWVQAQGFDIKAQMPASLGDVVAPLTAPAGQVVNADAGIQSSNNIDDDDSDTDDDDDNDNASSTAPAQTPANPGSMLAPLLSPGGAGAPAGQGAAP